MRVSAVFLVAAFSNLFADVIWYSIGASGKLEWFRRRTKVTDAQMDELQQGVSDNAVKMLLAPSYRLVCCADANRRWFSTRALATLVARCVCR